MGDLRVDLEGVGITVVSELVQSPSMGEITREGFEKGWTPHKSVIHTRSIYRNVKLFTKSQSKHHKIPSRHHSHPHSTTIPTRASRPLQIRLQTRLHYRAHPGPKRRRPLHSRRFLAPALLPAVGILEYAIDTMARVLDRVCAAGLEEGGE